MRVRVMIFVITLLMPFLAVSSEPFIVFDALLYNGKPDLSGIGIKPITVVYSRSEMFTGGTFDEAAWSTLVAKYASSTSPIVLDIEEWKVDGIPHDERDTNIARYLRALELARASAPGTKIGFYGLLPERNYWAPVRQDRKALQDWSDTNHSLDAIADKVDYVFPSLYTFYDDQAGWEVYAKAMLLEARRFKKPVYAFLWPEFHQGNSASGNRKLSADFWTRELNLCRRYADGVVIWGGFREPWDENAPWWIATKEFMRKQ